MDVASPSSEPRRVAAVTTVVVVALLVGCGPAGRIASFVPSAAPSQSASTSTASSASPTARPTPASVPDASQGPPAQLLLRLHSGSDAGDTHVLTVLDDGRAISTRYQDAFRVERVLTPTGIELLRDELRRTRLTEASGQYMPVANPGVEPPGMGIGVNVLEVAQPGGKTALINWYVYGDGPPGGSGDYYKPQPEAEVLDALATRLATLEEWLPSSAWAEPQARPYLPTQYRVLIFSAPQGGSFAVETTTVSWPRVGGVDAYGDVVRLVAQKRGTEDSSGHCRVVSVVEGTAVIEALRAAGAQSSSGLIPGIAFELGYRANLRQVHITLEPMVPFEDTTCGQEATF